MYKSYSELSRIKSYIDRYNYLRIGGFVGEQTFGGHRWINQRFYTSDRWRSVRDSVIIRDNGNDLGMDDPEYEIHGLIVVHHMNPVSLEDIMLERSCVFDPENLICCANMTHKAIHYGDSDLLIKGFVPRSPGDTDLW